MIVWNRKQGIGLLLLMGTILMFTGCGKKDMQVVIIDGQVKTRVEADSGESVEEILKVAEITISEKDVVTPDLKQQITQNGEEIVIQRCAAVTITDGDKVTEMEMTGKTVQDVFVQAGITLEEHDYVNHSKDAFLVEGMKISVIRRNAVSIVVDGKVIQCITAAKNVEELLTEQGIALDAKDRVKPSRTAKLSEGKQITIERVSVMEVVEEEPIEFETVTEYSNSMYTDEVVEKTPGVLGLKEVTYLITYVDGKEASREIVREKMIQEPVSRVVIQGTKQRRRIVSKQAVDDCDGSGHGYYIITWSDGTVEYEEY